MKVWRLRRQAKRLARRLNDLRWMIEYEAVTSTAKAHLAVEQEKVAEKLADVYGQLRRLGK